MTFTTNPVYMIKIEAANAEGELEIMEAFEWRGAEETGVQRAKDEAAKLGIKLVRVWAELLSE